MDDAENEWAVLHHTIKLMENVLLAIIGRGTARTSLDGVFILGGKKDSPRPLSWSRKHSTFKCDACLSCSGAAAGADCPLASASSTTQIRIPILFCPRSGTKHYRSCVSSREVVVEVPQENYRKMRYDARATMPSGHNDANDSAPSLSVGSGHQVALAFKDRWWRRRRSERSKIYNKKKIMTFTFFFFFLFSSTLHPHRHRKWTRISEST